MKALEWRFYNNINDRIFKLHYFNYDFIFSFCRLGNIHIRENTRRSRNLNPCNSFEKVSILETQAIVVCGYKFGTTYLYLFFVILQSHM